MLYSGGYKKMMLRVCVVRDIFSSLTCFEARARSKPKPVAVRAAPDFRKPRLEMDEDSSVTALLYSGGYKKIP